MLCDNLELLIDNMLLLIVMNVLIYGLFLVGDLFVN